MGDLGGRDLLERDETLADIDAVADATRAGTGAVVSIGGAPGIGKTALLEALRSRAVAAGSAVLCASGAERETELAYGVVRQLFAPVVDPARADRSLWDGAAAVAGPVVDPSGVPPARGQLDRFAVWHGLFWLCVSLAERKPLAVIVDDTQWVDESSMLWLAYLARRVAGLRLLLVVATRTEGAAGDPLPELRSGASVLRCRLGPLSERSSALLVRRAVGGDVPEQVCRSCHAATGGNPFYLGELVAAGGDALLSRGAMQVEEMVPASVVRSVLGRMTALGPEAIALARAVAVLGSRVSLRRAAALAELEPGQAERLADRLCAANILAGGRPLGFSHPIVRGAVYGELGEGARSALHHRAARVLADEGADPPEVAVRLLAAEPYGDPWVVMRLREAAKAAGARGDPRSAVAYLRRALTEPPEVAQRGDVLFELGSAERQLMVPEAEEHLRAALAIAEQPGLRAQIAGELMPILIQPGRLHKAEEIISQVLPAAVEQAPDLAAELLANRVSLPAIHLASAPADTGVAHQLLQRLDPQELPARLLRCTLGWQAMLNGRPLSEVGPLLDSALTNSESWIAQARDFTIFLGAIITAYLCERFTLAERACAGALKESERRGSVFASVLLWACRSAIALRLGQVRSAEADARQALDALEDFQVISPVAMLIDALVERGEIAEALDTLDRTGYASELPVTLLSLLFLPRRIRLRVAAGQLDAALDDVALAERLATQGGMERSTPVSWRADGAIACIAAGQSERARSLADEQLSLARAFGAPGALGVALRTAGIVHSAERRKELLAESVATLTQTPMRLELAKSLAWLGGAQRRAGERRRARTTLTRALDLADSCGGAATAAHARSELVIAGARPRRNRSHGRDALTATELRTATLAAGGMSNTQIAQALFVTGKTVERHLTNAYAKLGIGSRHELAGALGDPHPLEGRPRGERPAASR